MKTRSVVIRIEEDHSSAESCVVFEWVAHGKVRRAEFVVEVVDEFLRIRQVTNRSVEFGTVGDVIK